jgi:hypothetical protein
VDVCVSCEEDIKWMDSLDAWIHRSTGRKACDIHRPGRLITISGRREMRFTPHGGPGSDAKSLNRDDAREV